MSLISSNKYYIIQEFLLVGYQVHDWLFVYLMVFNATFNNISVISWRSVSLVEENGGPRENHRPVTSHWQTLSHNVVHLTLIEIELTTSVVISTDCIGSCKSNYHTIMATTAPSSIWRERSMKQISWKRIDISQNKTHIFENTSFLLKPVTDFTSVCGWS